MIKLFWIKLLTLVVIIAAGNMLALNHFSRPDLDEFYAKVSTPRTNYLILGSSRASQGLLPELVFRNKKAHQPVNFAFTMANSPYGRTYYKALKAKYKSIPKGGIVIFEVSPFSLSTSTTEMDSVYSEDYYFLNHLWSMSTSPNYSYLYLKYAKPLYKLCLPNVKKSMRLHQNGWLEVNVPADTIQGSTRILQKTKTYEKLALKSKIDDTRIHYLKEMITFCKPSKIILVRLPVGIGIYNVENTYFPEFNKQMKKMAAHLNVSYLDLYTPYSGQLKTTDGNHLWKGDAKKISSELNKFIVNN